MMVGVESVRRMGRVVEPSLVTSNYKVNTQASLQFTWK